MCVLELSYGDEQGAQGKYPTGQLSMQMHGGIMVATLARHPTKLGPSGTSSGGISHNQGSEVTGVKPRAQRHVLSMANSSLIG